MAGYIYIPVPTPEMLEFARAWQEGQLEKQNGQPEESKKEPYEILRNYESGWRKGAVRKFGFGVLRNVTHNDKVYILAHGATLGSRDIGVNRGATRGNGVNEWVGGMYKGYSPKALANVLKKEGLPEQFQDLRVFACGSAIIPPAGAVLSFAQELALAMRVLGYNQIRVTGYMGNVRPSYAIRQISGQPGNYTEGPHKGVEIGSQIFRASEHKVVF